MDKSKDNSSKEKIEEIEKTIKELDKEEVFSKDPDYSKKIRDTYQNTIEQARAEKSPRAIEEIADSISKLNAAVEATIQYKKGQEEFAVKTDFSDEEIGEMIPIGTDSENSPIYYSHYNSENIDDRAVRLLTEKIKLEIEPTQEIHYWREREFDNVEPASISIEKGEWTGNYYQAVDGERNQIDSSNAIDAVVSNSIRVVSETVLESYFSDTELNNFKLETIPNYEYIKPIESEIDAKPSMYKEVFNDMMSQKDLSKTQFDGVKKILDNHPILNNKHADKSDLLNYETSVENLYKNNIDDVKLFDQYVKQRAKGNDHEIALSVVSDEIEQNVLIAGHSEPIVNGKVLANIAESRKQNLAAVELTFAKIEAFDSEMNSNSLGKIAKNFFKGDAQVVIETSEAINEATLKPGDSELTRKRIEDIEITQSFVLKEKMDDLRSNAMKIFSEREKFISANETQDTSSRIDRINPDRAAAKDVNIEKG